MGFEEYKPILVMVGCQCLYSGTTIFARAALLQDMSSRVFVVYRQTIAFFLIAPFAYFSRRSSKGCKMNWNSFLWIFLISFVGVTAYQNIYFEGMNLSSSGAASALANVVPAVTFILAYILGLEQVKLRSIRSMAKIVGTLLCVIGAVGMALVKGPKLLNSEHLLGVSLFRQSAGADSWVLGCFLLLASNCCWSLWLILQVRVSACYPDHISLTAWMCLFAASQCAVVTLLVEPDLNAWKLTSTLQLFSCFYAGFVSAVTFFAQAWCISQRGPLFSAMFNPLCTVIVTVVASIFLHEELYTGSLIGGLAVILGLYIVLWGKAKEHKDVDEEILPIKKLSDQENLLGQDSFNQKGDLEAPLLIGNKEISST